MMCVEVRKRDELQRACPDLDLQMSLVGPPEKVIILGWKGDTAAAPLVRVESTSYAEAEREYRKSYARLAAAGIIGGAR